ncbi:DUF1080 domain-containing protein [Sphingobacterium puteale]|uniref:DUF1080 domain-containing protein n=1 Tax=Sphingobacterium puteale TaxID=2420510 RepID=A0A420W3G2_9SPHI|nr:DUF1080 domain-containing protein [Sphingobacterium puteale]RKO73091.1 DUF1080 domain-containing protein [Sphingobacterium puteale]
MKRLIYTIFSTLLLNNSSLIAQTKTLFDFGQEIHWEDWIANKKNSKTIHWINVNTDRDTWLIKKNLLICKGKPIGIVRSTKQYENFMIEVEWNHQYAGGNSGIFVWSDANPDPSGRLPGGVEVQMLELDWVNQNLMDGKQAPIAYVHGELFGVGGVTTVPDNPRGTRSKSIENRAKGKGEWNKYTIVCIDGTIKLAVNGKFVNGLRNSSIKKGYLCLESEGSEIHFRNFKLIELPPGVTSDQQVVPGITP